MLTFTKWHNYYLSDHLTTSNNINFHQCERGRKKKKTSRKKKESLTYWQTAL